MTAYTPKEYAEQVYHGKVTPKTVRNWIKYGKLPKGTVVEYTPTGRAIIKVIEIQSNKVSDLVKLMEAKFNGTKTA